MTPIPRQNLFKDRLLVEENKQEHRIYIIYTTIPQAVKKHIELEVSTEPAERLADRARATGFFSTHSVENMTSKGQEEIAF